MITIKTANSSVQIERAQLEGSWGPTRDSRQYLIRTFHGDFPVDIDGFQAALAVFLSEQSGLSREEFDELDFMINDMLDIWQNGPLAMIDLSVVPTLYTVSHGGKVKYSGSDHLGISKYLADLGFERLVSKG